MLTQSQLLRSTRLLLRFVNAPDPARTAIVIQNERIAAGIPMVRETKSEYRELHRSLVQVVHMLEGKGLVERRATYYKIKMTLHPEEVVVPMGAAFSWSPTYGLSMEPVVLSLRVEFAIALAELASKRSSVAIYRCRHQGCGKMWATEMGRGTGKGSKSHHCALHTPPSTRHDNEE